MANGWFKLAPGVEVFPQKWGHLVSGQRADLLAAWVVEPEWFPEGLTPTGRPIRSRTTVVGELAVTVRESYGGQWHVAFADWDNTSPRQCFRSRRDRARYDGNVAVSWTDCAWQPRSAA